MTSPESSIVVTPQRAWFVGGALLLSTLVLGLADPAVAALIGVGDILRTTLFSASLLVFAFGLRGSGSVTARRPLGTVALTLLAGWLLFSWLLTTVAVGASSDSLPGWLGEFGYINVFVQFALALVAVIQIARAGVVPAPWSWAPTWALAAVSVPWLAAQIVVAGDPRQTASTLLFVIGAADSLAHVGSVMVLGVLAIVLADRSAPSRTAVAVVGRLEA